MVIIDGDHDDDGACGECESSRVFALAITRCPQREPVTGTVTDPVASTISSCRTPQATPRDRS